ncbi:MAG TPA: DUF86 domain-containing protein [Nitrospirae bacterium]|nr:DUF86 domain-containing protein [Nitrospirota bacterium]HDZ01524.1 DUF86 domain-containing protein [Nitrospirota bacterium]
MLVDKSLITKKLERVGSYLEQVYRKKDPGIAAFLKDRDIQSIILFNIIQAIQSCIDIGAHIISDSQWETPSTQAEIFEILAENKVITKSLAKKMIQMAGFRNRIVHEYEKTDMKIVHTVWKKHLTDIKKYCKAVVLKYNL